MTIHLRVIDAFGDHAKGDTISDPEMVVLLRNDIAHCVAFTADDLAQNIAAEMAADKAAYAREAAAGVN